MKKIIEKRIELMSKEELMEFYGRVLFPTYESGIILAQHTRSKKFMIIAECLSILVLEDLLTRLGRDKVIKKAKLIADEYLKLDGQFLKESSNVNVIMEEIFNDMSEEEIKDFYAKVYIPMCVDGINYANCTGVTDYIRYMTELCFIAHYENSLIV